MSVTAEQLLPAAREIINATADQLLSIGADARDDVAALLSQHEQDIAEWIADGNVGQLAVLQDRINTILYRSQLTAVHAAANTLNATLIVGVRSAVAVLASL